MSVLGKERTVTAVWGVTVALGLLFASLGSVFGIVITIAFASVITIAHLVYTVEEMRRSVEYY